jgi:hypothetical protein
MPGLLRGVARTAVVAGTATAVSGRVRRRQDAKFADRDAQLAADREQAYEERVAPPPPSEPAPMPQQRSADSTSATLDQLKTLGDLKAQGVLTEEEFAAQKARILGG